MTIERFGDRLRRYMDAAGVRPGTLAREVSVTPEAVSRWLAGDRFPRAQYLAAIAQALAVSVEDLMGNAAPGEIGYLQEAGAAEPGEDWRKLTRAERHAVNEIVRLFARGR